MLSIHLTQRDDDTCALRIKCADAEVFDLALKLLKTEVAPAHRRFDFPARCWVIAEAGAEQLERYLNLVEARWCADVLFEDEPATGAEYEQGRSSSEHAICSGGMTIDEAYAALYIQAGAPDEVIHAAYRALAKLRHPDVGGTTAAMVEINKAYELLTRGRAANAA